jgi:hypothetical protein
LRQLHDAGVGSFKQWEPDPAGTNEVGSKKWFPTR